MSIKLTDLPKKILVWDIETPLIAFYGFRLGEQIVRHGQIMQSSKHNKFDIICISYMFNDGKPPKTLNWGYKKQDSRKMVEEFDEIIGSADIIVGKNSDKFDVKYINTMRWMHKLPPLPDWTSTTDDVEKLVRKAMALPSYSLDYLNKVTGGDGKVKMDFDDWVHIAEQTPEKGPQAFEKMQFYNRKDVQDTYDLLESVWEYVQPRHSMRSKAQTEMPQCYYCGSDKIHRNGTRLIGQSHYQNWYCNGHGGYAGRSLLSKTDKTPVLKT